VDAGGVVKLDGNPLSNAVVIFEDMDGSFSFGKTDEKGRYSLQFDSETAGVKPGEKTVRISTGKKLVGAAGVDESDPDGTREDENGKTVKVVNNETVPAKYNTQSELQVEVTNEESSYDFDLKG